MDAFIHQLQTVNMFQGFVGHISAAVRPLGSQSKEPGFESSCCHFKTLAI